MKWLVLYTKPHFELKVAKLLVELGISAYCPTYKVIKQYSDRKKKVERPLIRSYVFVQLEEKDRASVFAVPGVVRYLFWLGKPAVVREEEIALMQNNLNGVYDYIRVEKLEIGAAYTIPQGPFKGQKGNVVSIAKKNIKLELPSLGMMVLLKAA
tara:strand:+ start:1922 stop:2383 length:462 start_codon:yes stop_codon:yes gene_type:complete